MRTNLGGRTQNKGLWLAVSLLVGCSLGSQARHDALWREYASNNTGGARGGDGAVFVGEHLERTALIEAVIARNPDVAAAREGLRAALAEVPQATALDDPMISYSLAPLSVAGDAPFGHRVEIRQRLPFPGKRALRGNAALHAAEAEATELDAVRLELAQMASELFDDYHVVERAIEINHHHRELMAEMKAAAAAQYVAGRAAQQDPIQAEVELGQLEVERLGLEAERDQIVTRLNGLLHRRPAEMLPPPGPWAPAPAPAGTSEELQSIALERAPRRAAARARIAAAQAELAATRRETYPDLELMAAYDSMWDMPEHRWMVGVMIEVPLQRGRRNAAIDGAEAMTAQRRIDDDRLVDQIRVEVDLAHRRVIEAGAVVAVNEQALLPAVRDQLAAARAGFASAQNSFLAVIEAEENVREAELGAEMARAELSRRHAALARAVGLVPGLPVGGAP